MGRHSTPKEALIQLLHVPWPGAEVLAWVQEEKHAKSAQYTPAHFSVHPHQAAPWLSLAIANIIPSQFESCAPLMRPWFSPFTVPYTHSILIGKTHAQFAYYKAGGACAEAMAVAFA